MKVYVLILDEILDCETASYVIGVYHCKDEAQQDGMITLEHYLQTTSLYSYEFRIEDFDVK